MRIPSALKDRLASPFAYVWSTALALLILLPTLGNGMAIDDYAHRLVLDERARLPGMVGSPTDVFIFAPNDPAMRVLMADKAHGPWWASQDLRLAFWRPLSSLWHWVDYTFWPAHPWVMHAENLVVLAALCLAAGVLYRRLLAPAWVAGLAAFFFALDDAHGLPVGWIANRNGVLTAAFGAATLLAHDRWRRDAWRPGAALGPLAFTLSLLSGEASLAALGYLAAHALFLDRGTRARRALALSPYAALTLAWAIAYKLQGYGARGSGAYVDPVGEPLAFLRAAMSRIPALLVGQLGAPPSDFAPLIGEETWWLLAIDAVFLGLAVWVLAPRFRRDPVTRFFAVGMVLSIVPACATFANDRLLMLPGLGGMGLVAQLIGDIDAPGFEATPIAWRRPAKVLGAAWLVLHGVLGPLTLLPKAFASKLIGAMAARMVASAPDDEAVRSQTLIVVNALDILSATYVPIWSAANGRTMPKGYRCLGASPGRLRATRPDATTLVLRPDAGYLSTPIDLLVRAADRRFEVGYEVRLTGLRVVVLEVTPDGRPAEVAFHFDAPLEDPSFRWIVRDRRVFVPFTPPAVGETVVVDGGTFAEVM